MHTLSTILWYTGRVYVALSKQWIWHLLCYYFIQPLLSSPVVIYLVHYVMTHQSIYFVSREKQPWHQCASLNVVGSICVSDNPTVMYQKWNCQHAHRSSHKVLTQKERTPELNILQCAFLETCTDFTVNLAMLDVMCVNAQDIESMEAPVVPFSDYPNLYLYFVSFKEWKKSHGRSWGEKKYGRKTKWRLLPGKRYGDNISCWISFFHIYDFAYADYVACLLAVMLYLCVYLSSTKNFTGLNLKSPRKYSPPQKGFPSIGSRAGGTVNSGLGRSKVIHYEYERRETDNSGFCFLFLQKEALEGKRCLF